MTEKTVRIAPFLFAFFAAPLLVTALTFWMAYIPLAALLLGGPFYVALGLPTLALYLRRHPPRYIPILLLSLIAVLGVVPILGLAYLLTGEEDYLDLIPLFFRMGAVFASVWSLTFTALYRALIHR